MSEKSNCELCGEPMPDGEEMFKFHGYSGPCPKPPLAQEEIGYRDLIADGGLPEAHPAPEGRMDPLLAAEPQHLADDILAWQAGDFGDEVTLTDVIQWHMKRMAQLASPVPTHSADARAKLEQAMEKMDLPLLVPHKGDCNISKSWGADMACTCDQPERFAQLVRILKRFAALLALPPHEGETPLATVGSFEAGRRAGLEEIAMLREALNDIYTLPLGATAAFMRIIAIDALRGNRQRAADPTGHLCAGVWRLFSQASCANCGRAADPETGQ